MIDVGSGAAATGAATETMEMIRQRRPRTAADLEMRLIPKFALRFNPACAFRNIYLSIMKSYEVSRLFISDIPIFFVM
jgi:hypothetical protein